MDGNQEQCLNEWNIMYMVQLLFYFFQTSNVAFNVSAGMVAHNKYLKLSV
jgi:hypothetical protein